MKSAPTVLILSYHFHPSIEIGARRITALARYLSRQGLRVIVVSEFGGKAIEHEAELFPNVIAIPVEQPKRRFIDSLLSLKRRLSGAPATNEPAPAARPAVPSNADAGDSMSLAARLSASFFKLLYFLDPYKKWSWLAARAAVRAGSKYGAKLVISSGPPYSTLLAGKRAAGRLGIPHVADLRDPWTDNDLQSLRGVELAVLRRMERSVMHSADAITATAASLTELLANRYPAIQSKFHTVRNGFDGALVAAPETTQRRLSILFAGEIYMKRDPFPLLTAMEALLQRPEVDPSRVSLTFMGRCSAYNGVSLADWLRDKKSANVVRILPQMPTEAVAKAIDESTVLLNLAQEQLLGVPAKTYEHLASGREILVICEDNSETAKLVRGVQGVVQVDPRDAAALERALVDLYARHVTEGKLTAPAAHQVLQYARDSINESFLSLMRSVAQLS